MKSPFFQVLTVLICVAVTFPVKADPIIALASLILAEKMAKPKQPVQQHNTTGWRDLLSTNEKQVLDQIEGHPAIHACILRADQENPVAAYHIRKIATYSAHLRDKLKQGEEVSTARSAYLWPAKGFRWCKQQAGMATSEGSGTLQRQARQIASLVEGRDYRSKVAIAMNEKIITE